MKRRPSDAAVAAGAVVGHGDAGLASSPRKKARRRTTSVYKNAPSSLGGASTTTAASSSTSALSRQRPADLSAARAALPVAAGRDAIVEALRQHDSIIVLGETGSGKTTQIPQYLFEAGFADGDNSASGSARQDGIVSGHKRKQSRMIAITQPRRVAATSLASRVAAEMGCQDPAKLPIRTFRAKDMAKTTDSKSTNRAPALVGYSIRFDDRSGPDTRIRFMTDGWILREMIGPSLTSSKTQRTDASSRNGQSQDKSLKGKEKAVANDAASSDIPLASLLLSYAVIIIDEAHERTLDTDLILGLAKRIQATRKQLRHQWLHVHKADPSHPLAAVTELKLVIMSATLDAKSFSNYFASSPPIQLAGSNTSDRVTSTPAPILYVEGRQHPVTLYHTPAPVQDWADAALRTILQIHVSKPDAGDILVFLTGQEEIEKLAASLRAVAEWVPDWVKARQRINGATANGTNSHASETNGHDNATTSGDEGTDESSSEEESSSANPIDSIISNGLSKLQSNGSSKAHRRMAQAVATTHSPVTTPTSDIPTNLIVAPIYAALGSSATTAVFAPTPANARKVVLATNIAETSVTIPGIVYVIDCGFAKEKVYSPTSGIEVLRSMPISQSAARQRTGRAGRIQAGECYRLYTEAAFNSLDEMGVPEILKTDLSAAALQLYAAGLDPFTFDWMDAPDEGALRAALQALVLLGAVAMPNESISTRSGAAAPAPARITQLGRRMAALPLSPVHARTLIAASERGGPRVARQARDLVALLSVDRSVFVDPNAAQLAQQATKQKQGGAVHADVDDAREEALSRRVRAGLIHRSGDHGTALNVLYAFLDVLDSTETVSGGAAGKKATNASVRAWCQANLVHEKTVRNVLHIRAQLRTLCRQNGIECDDEDEDGHGHASHKSTNGHFLNGNGHPKSKGSNAKAVVNGGSASANGVDESSGSSSSESDSDADTSSILSSSKGLFVTRKSVASLASSAAPSSTTRSRTGWKDERYEQLREILCEGRLGNIAFRQTDGTYKRIGQSQTFKIHPSSALHGRGAAAIVFEELVHTTQHFARMVSSIEPAWAQSATPPLS